MTPTANSFWRSPANALLLSGFVAGTLDISCAIFFYTIVMTKTTIPNLMHYIASSVVGNRAFQGGFFMSLFGLLIHYMIAFSFATAYFYIYPHAPFLRKNKIASAIGYGFFVWFTMNIIVVPLVFSRHPNFVLGPALLAMAILMFAIGLPVAFITAKYYSGKQNPV